MNKKGSRMAGGVIIIVQLEGLVGSNLLRQGADVEIQSSALAVSMPLRCNILDCSMKLYTMKNVQELGELAKSSILI